ncbi:MAG: choice-of-anchor J domain-containing protein [Bacteroidetes bacterium]|nr:choice-of-anchor J domain-containing protein [Bacteroidota bacterium]
MRLFTRRLRTVGTFLGAILVAGAVQAQTVFSSSGTWTCPPGVTSVTVQCWGGGGGGGGTNANPAAGNGGAGGSFAQGTVTVVPGTVYTVTVGAGGAGGTNTGGNGGNGAASSFGGTLVVAEGGAGGNGSLAGAGTATGSTAASTGSILYAGGNGGSATGTSASGGGGGGAGTTAAGGNAANEVAGTGGAVGGGSGGSGRTSAGAGRTGNTLGGGGSGGLRTSGTARGGGAGAAGQVSLTCASCYCVPSGSGTSAYITNITTTGGFTNLNNSSGASGGGYGDYTSHIPTVMQTASGVVNVAISFVGSGGGTGLAVYVDWNHDGSFSEPGDSVWSTNGSYSYVTPTVATFSVPAGQPDGSYTMRVVADYYSSSPAACSDDITGESEDYTFVVGQPCLTVTPPTTTICRGESVMLTVAGSTGGVYTWSPAAGLSSATGDTVIATPDSSVTYLVSSSGSCGVAATAEITVNEAPTALTASPDTATVCAGSIQALTATGGAVTQTILSEDFEGAFPPAGWASLIQDSSSSNYWIALNDGEAHGGSGAAEYDWNSGADAQAYLITSGLPLIGGVTYTLSYWEEIGLSSYPEKLQITLGDSQTVSAQIAGTVIQPTTTYTNTSYAQQTLTFTPATSGTYYLSFNCLSIADQYVLNIDDIQLSGPVPGVTWSPTTGLYTDAAATVPYTGTMTSNVYARVSAPVQYVASAASASGCTKTDTVTLTPLAPVSLVVTDPAPVCASATADLTASAVTAGSEAGLSYSYYTDSTATTIYATPAAAVIGTYYVKGTNGTGCSTIAPVTVTGIPTDSTMLTQTICAGTTYTFNGTTLSAAGTYYDTLTAATGCDSLVILNLTVNPLDTTTLTEAICAGTTYTFNGTTLSAAGTYYDTLTAATGCDSLVILNLTVNPLDTTTLTQAICAGSTYTFNGTALSAAGTYYDTLTAATGCDSLVILNLTVNPLDTTTLTQAICAGSTYTFNGTTLSAAGTYYDTLTAGTGCDSLVILNLTVNPLDTTTLAQTICAGSTYTFNGTTLSVAGTYYDTLTAGTGCDSLVILHLAILSADTTTIRQSICQGSGYTFGGQILTQAGTYADTMRSAGGCDSAIVRLVLTVNALPVPTITNANTVLSTQTESQYQWFLNGAVIGGATSQSYTPTQNGNYTVYVTDVNGCSDTSAVYALTTIGIAELPSGYNVKLYPNPNTGSFTLSFADAQQRDIEIRDVIGNVLGTSSSTESSIKFNMGDVAAGIYYMNIRQNGQSYSLKFTVAK